jgi:hypothetical protein
MNLDPQGTAVPESSCNTAATVPVRQRWESFYLITCWYAPPSPCSASLSAAPAGSAACLSPSGRRFLSRLAPLAHHAIFRSAALPEECLRLTAFGPEPSTGKVDERWGSRLIQQAGDSLSAGSLCVAAKNPALQWAKAAMISRDLVRGEGVLIRREADEKLSIRNHALALQWLVCRRHIDPQSKTTPPPGGVDAFGLQRRHRQRGHLSRETSSEPSPQRPRSAWPGSCVSLQRAAAISPRRPSPTQGRNGFAEQIIKVRTVSQACVRAGRCVLRGRCPWLWGRFGLWRDVNISDLTDAS